MSLRCLFEKYLLGKSDCYDLKSSLCKQAQLESKDFQKKCQELKVEEWFSNFSKVNNCDIPKDILHRKSWEYAYIALVLQERKMLTDGKKGLGFAVGTEPLPAYFASKGCMILATDLASGDENAESWIGTGQNAGGDVTVLNTNGICSESIFKKNVKYQNLDMNNIGDDISGYDFCWSSCAIEHVGSLEKSKMFLKNMLKILKPGGIAVHTTEYNLSSEEETIFNGDSVIYRKKDIVEISDWLKLQGHKIDLDLSLGKKEGDLFTDQPPYYQINKRYHLRLNIGGYDSTSIGLIIEKR